MSFSLRVSSEIVPLHQFVWLDLLQCTACIAGLVESLKSWVLASANNAMPAAESEWCKLHLIQSGTAFSS